MGSPQALLVMTGHQRQLRPVSCKASNAGGENPGEERRPDLPDCPEHSDCATWTFAPR